MARQAGGRGRARASPSVPFSPTRPPMPAMGLTIRPTFFMGSPRRECTHPASPPWIPAFAGMTMALRRPHKGMKMASSLGMVEADPAPGPSSGTPQDDMTGRPGAIFIAMTGGGGAPSPRPSPVEGEGVGARGVSGLVLRSRWVRHRGLARASAVRVFP